MRTLIRLHPSTAEGIEDQATWNSLVQKRCDLVQGYALSKPLPAAELDALLHTVPRVAPAATQDACRRPIRRTPAD
jgi:sensor c-di-GMP phosphodiesterase-like protein